MIATAILMLGLLIADAPSEKSVKRAENCYANARVGDSTNYKVTMSNPLMAALNLKFTGKLAVIAKTADSVTLKFEINEDNNGVLVAQEMKVNLKEDFNFAHALNASSDTKLAFEMKQLANGRGKTVASGNEYDCSWVTTQYSIAKEITKVKVWRTKEVPLEGIVRLEIERPNDGMTLEFVSFAKGK